MQGVAAANVLPVAVAVLLLAVARCRGQTLPPNSGVLLYSQELGQVFSNNSLIASSDIGGLNNGIACYTAAGSMDEIPDGAVWKNPNGDTIRIAGSSSATSFVFFSQLRPHRLTMQRGGVEFSAANDGVYACHIDDEAGVRQTLFIGVYTPDSLAGPVVHTPTFSLLTELTALTPIFTITCPSSSSPPSAVVWLMNGSEVSFNGGEFESSQVLVNALSSGYDNVLRVMGGLMGLYTCRVSNVRGSNEASLTVRVPSGPPTGLQASPGGRGSMRVTWTPPTSGAEGYLIVYRPSVINPSESVSIRIDNATATSYLIGNIVAGTEYTIQMLAFAELPTSLSNSITIILHVPGQVMTVVATATSSSEVRVLWEGSAADDGVEGYVVLYKPATSMICEGVKGGEVRVEGEGVREWVITGLEEGVDYGIRVAAYNSIGDGEPSDPPAEVYTLEKAPSGPPLSVTLRPTSPTSLLVSWQPPDCLLWNSRLLSNYTLHYHSLLPLREVVGDVSMVFGELNWSLSGLTSFMNYSVSVSASNAVGIGPHSEEVFAALVDAPSALDSVTSQPDILSVLVSWNFPERERGYITMVTVEYYNSGGVQLGSSSVSSGEMSHRLTGLQPRSSYNVSLTPHTSNPTPGPTHSFIVSTIAIGVVSSVKVVVINSTAVNVSWTPLPSVDVIAYTVYYSRLTEPASVAKRQSSVSEMFLIFPVKREEGRVESGVGWGLVGGLEEGGEYAFSVVAMVMIGGTSMSGDRTEPVVVTIEKPNATGDGGINTVIIIAAVAGVLLIALVLVGFLIICFLIRRWKKSGKMEVASAMELRPHPTPLPLPTFYPPTINLASSRPEIIDPPTDIIAVEGERVDFRLKVAGYPEPNVVWYHNGCMVGADYATEISDDGGLTLVAVEHNHEGTYRYTVSNSVGSIQGKVTLYVTSEMNGWGRQRGRGLELPKVISCPVTVEQFPQYMEEKRANSSRFLRDQFLCLNNCEDGHSTSIALSSSNKKFNRFLNIVTYDDNRLKLKPLNGRDDCQNDYINASYVDGYGIAKKFVATQGATDTTVVDFWRMAWQLHCPTIVMMTNLEENRKKCERYWPEFGTADYGPYTVTLAEQKILADYTIRKLTLTSSFSTRHVHYLTHYQFTSWPDHDVPDYVAPLLEFHRKIKREHRPNKGPIIVHCSAGVGRSGAFIVLDTALGQAQGEHRMDIPDIITRLRNQRMKMVQTPEQYIFLHEALFEALTCGNTRIEASELEAALEELLAPAAHSGRSRLEEQFAMLNAVTPQPEHSACRIAVEYPRKNRSMDYLPTDQWRVVLMGERPNYIHASFGCSYRQKHAFIIAQAPLEETCRDFWKMVYERECGVIVMLSGLVEEGQVICQRYWPTNAVELYGEYAVSPVEENMYDGFLERIFSVTDSKLGQAHYVSQFQVLGWSSDGQTATPKGIVSCMSHVENAQRRSGNTPVVVHCSDGVTRTGLFCAGMAAIDCCKSEGVVDVFQAVRALRQQRPGAIPLAEHYRLLHELLLIFLQSFSTYSNFK